MSSMSSEPRLLFSVDRAQDVLESVMRHSGDCVMVLDLDGVVLRWNSACEDLFGWSAREVIGERLPHISQEHRLRILAELREVAAADGIAERDFRSVRSDGSKPIVQATMIPLYDQDGDAAGILAIVREILGDDRFDRHREEFLRLVGEELSDPLTSIVSASDLLARPEIARDGSKQIQLTSLISHRAREAASLVEDLMLASRLAAGALVLNRDPVDLNVLVSDAVTSMPDAENRIAVDLDPRREKALVDAGPVRRAVMELVRAALTGAPEDRLVHVSVTYGDTEATIEVDGGGTSGQPGRLRLGSASAVEVPGACGGLGISLAGGVADAHGGAFRVADSDDGCAFVLSLPLVCDADDSPRRV